MAANAHTPTTLTQSRFFLAVTGAAAGAADAAAAPAVGAAMVSTGVLVRGGSSVACTSIGSAAASAVSAKGLLAANDAVGEPGAVLLPTVASEVLAAAIVATSSPGTVVAPPVEAGCCSSGCRSCCNECSGGSCCCRMVEPHPVGRAAPEGSPATAAGGDWCPLARESPSCCSGNDLVTAVQLRRAAPST